MCLNKWAAVVTFVFVKKYVPLYQELSNAVAKKTELDELRRSYKQEEGFTVIEKFGVWVVETGQNK